MRTRSGQSSGGSSGSEQSGGFSSSGTSSSRSEGAGVERGTRAGPGQSVTTRRWARGGPMMTPWDLMRRATEEMSRLLESIDTGRTGFTAGSTGLLEGAQTGAADRRGIGMGMFVPPIEVEQRSDAVVVRTDLPGIDPDQINVSVNDGVLNISGERTQEQREEAEGYIRSERRYGTFYRAIPLPDGADEEKVNAAFENGVLEITIPLSGRQQGRQIPVQSTSPSSRTRGTQGESRMQGSTGSQGQSTQSQQHGSQAYSGQGSPSQQSTSHTQESHSHSR